MFRICRIIAETKEQENSLKEYLGGYPVEITQELDLKRIVSPEALTPNIPTLMIGWNSTKHMFPDQKIHNSEVIKNVFWTYNESECKEIKDESFHKNIEDFVYKNLKNWLPSDFIKYDSIINGDFSKFIETNIDNSILTYIHFNNGAIYMRNGDKNIIINAKSLWLTESNYRTLITELFNKLNCMIYSYDDIENYVNLDSLGDILALDVIRWIKYNTETPIKYFQIVPNIDISKYIPFLMSKIPSESLELDEEEEVFLKRMCERDRITRWMSTRHIAFSYDFNKNLDFLYRDYSKLARINYSNKRTITGRITSNDRYNPQNLSKSNDDRAMIISRFRNGKIYQFDFTSFEIRIAIYLCGDEEFIEEYYDKDIHAETAIIIFETPDFTNEQRAIAKDVNHAILYGAGEATILKRLEGLPYPHEKMFRVKQFLSPIFEKSKELMDLAENRGYLINKWGSIIRPEKSYAGFNNYIQSTASEIIVDKVIEIKNILVGKRSQFMFQVHDSIVLDVHPEEGELVHEIAKAMSCHKGMLFSVNYKSGINYKDLSSESTYF